MKNKILLVLMIQAIGASVYAQPTRYGNFSGLAGPNSSYFGLFAGNLGNGSSNGNAFFGQMSGMASQAAFNSGFGTETLKSNTTGSGNSAVGYQVLWKNSTGLFNTGVGYVALRENTTGSMNTASGSYALQQNITGKENSAFGHFALAVAQTADYNTAVGSRALKTNKTGSFNTAVGAFALESTDDGYWNTGIGAQALAANTSGTQNTATGESAAQSNSRGFLNTANGWATLQGNETGNRNSAFGAKAGQSVKNFDNTTALGYDASPSSSNSVRLGNISVTSIGGTVMWAVVSDGRFKRNIKEDITGLDFVNLLRPVSYEVDKAAYRKHMNLSDSSDGSSVAMEIPSRETGFIAQEVDAIVKKSGFVFNGVESPKSDGDHYSIRYAAFVVPLVKAVQELTAQLNEQQSEIDALKEKLELTDGKPDAGSVRKSTLFQNTPNPFTLDTEIKMELPETTRQASVTIFNMEGKELKTVMVSQRGSDSIKLSANDLSAGMYLYALIVDGKVVDTKRLVLTR